MQAHIGYKDKHPHFIYLYSLCGAANKWARELYLINCLLSVEELTLSPHSTFIAVGGGTRRPPLDCSHLIDSLPASNNGPPHFTHHHLIPSSSLEWNWISIEQQGAWTLLCCCCRRLQYPPIHWELIRRKEKINQSSVVWETIRISSD